MHYSLAGRLINPYAPAILASAGRISSCDLLQTKVFYLLQLFLTGRTGGGE